MNEKITINVDSISGRRRRRHKPVPQSTLLWIGLSFASVCFVALCLFALQFNTGYVAGSQKSTITPISAKSEVLLKAQDTILNSAIDEHLRHSASFSLDADLTFVPFPETQAELFNSDVWEVKGTFLVTNYFGASLQYQYCVLLEDGTMRPLFVTLDGTTIFRTRTIYDD